MKEFKTVIARSVIDEAILKLEIASLITHNDKSGAAKGSIIKNKGV
ncbi:hypothetical protein KAI19_04215 [bacterium]|nr:hypothetical protein [bacterium]